MQARPKNTKRDDIRYRSAANISQTHAVKSEKDDHAPPRGVFFHLNQLGLGAISPCNKYLTGQDMKANDDILYDAFHQKQLLTGKLSFGRELQFCRRHDEEDPGRRKPHTGASPPRKHPPKLRTGRTLRPRGRPLQRLPFCRVGIPASVRSIGHLGVAWRRSGHLCKTACQSRNKEKPTAALV